MSNQPDPRSRPQTSPEIDPAPSPGSPEKRFPAEPTPMAKGKQQAAESADDDSSEAAGSAERLGSGEDPDVESGVDKNDPEQPASNDDEVEKSYE